VYTSYYLCRYNLSLSNKAISDEFGFSKAQMGTIITSALLAYACGQVSTACSSTMGRQARHADRRLRHDRDEPRVRRASFWGILGLFVVLRSIDVISNPSAARDS